MLDVLVLLGCVVVIAAVVVGAQLRRRNTSGPVPDNPGDDFNPRDRSGGDNGSDGGGNGD